MRYTCKSIIVNPIPQKTLTDLEINRVSSDGISKVFCITLLKTLLCIQLKPKNG